MQGMGVWMKEGLGGMDVGVRWCGSWYAMGLSVVGMNLYALWNVAGVLLNVTGAACSSSYSDL